MKKVVSAIALAVLAASAGAQTYFKKEYYAPAPIWGGAQGTYWYTIEDALHTKDVELRNSGGNYVGDWGWSCRAWDNRNCGSWAYNKDYLPVLYAVHHANGVKYGEQLITASLMCPNGANTVQFYDYSLVRVWRACEMVVPVAENPGPQPAPQNPFVTGVDWVINEGCQYMNVNFAGKVFTFCFNRMQVY
ncbi:hypothetical protein [Delftia acidovorans]|uniref:hypothetical protein n=1 Tax=Delftia acidovorans TaxID=80866 RepID=UPI0011413BA7|nr:hypothetical protein [Delftia acidovorans]